ncbi:hypothetical protein, partial [Streptomyces sp. Root1310]|uniref:hypothetical protein n=1 Tax=Streptomyces sp. Root1310 TaxID=1736452 RepID=UPI001F5B35D3
MERVTDPQTTGLHLPQPRDHLLHSLRLTGDHHRRRTIDRGNRHTIGETLKSGNDLRLTRLHR